jgi:small subunit ribosomal protein S9
MADEPTPEEVEEPAAPEAPVAEEPAAVEEPVAEPVAEEPVAVEEPVTEEPVAKEPVAEQEPAVAEPVAVEEPAPEPVAEEPTPAEPVAEEPAVAEPAAAEDAGEEIVVEEIVAEVLAPGVLVEESLVEEGAAAEVAEEEDEEEEPAPRVKPAVPGAHLEVDIVLEGEDPLAREAPADPYAIEEYEEEAAAEEEVEEETALPQPISTAAIDLAAGARYRATGKRKTAIARVTLRPGSGTYLVNGRTLEEHFPRVTLQRNIRQPLETVGYEERMDVVARLHGGGISAQAGALRHGVSRALLEADPNLRGELKRRGFLTRDARAKERKKAGLKKARKRPQFSKR